MKKWLKMPYWSWRGQETYLDISTSAAHSDIYSRKRTCESYTYSYHWGGVKGIRELEPVERTLGIQQVQRTSMTSSGKRDYWRSVSIECEPDYFDPAYLAQFEDE